MLWPPLVNVFLFLFYHKLPVKAVFFLVPAAQACYTGDILRIFRKDGDDIK